MPLSEEEIRLLEQMERALVAEDPKLASTLRGTALRRNARRRSYVAIGAFVLGVVILMTGAVAAITWVGIIGFVIMLVASYVAVTAWRGQNAPTPSDASTLFDESTPRSGGFSVIQGGKTDKKGRRLGKGGRAPKSSGSFMDRMEERWRRRRDQNGGF